MYIIINTTDDKKIEVILAQSEDAFKIKSVSGEKKQSERLLATIENLLIEGKTTPAKLKGIGVVTGPGGFTSVRIGVVVANTLAYALNKNVFGIKKMEFKDSKDLVKIIIAGFKAEKAKKIVLPYYDREPNIS